MDKRKIWHKGLNDSELPELEKVCILVNKVYDACSQKECEEIQFEGLLVPSDVPLEDLDAQCKIIPGSETYEVISMEPVDEGPLSLVKVDVCAEIKIKVFDKNEPDNYELNEEEVCFTKQVILYAPENDKMEVLVESIFQVLKCEAEVIDDNGQEFVVNTFIGAFIIIKTAMNVQLLVPSYGFCPVPDECDEIKDICDLFKLKPFPDFFPPQQEDFPQLKDD